MSGYRPSWLGPDIIAGITLAAVSIPECMGYTKIVGMPVVTGLYTILLPIVAFAIFGSSRHLVVGADSATAAIIFAALTPLAQPASAQWVALASMSALLTAAFLFVAWIVRLGFLANFLSRTVLAGFLTGVGITLLVGQRPDMLGVTVSSREFLLRLLGSVEALPRLEAPTLIMSLTVLAVILLTERFFKAVPGALLAVILAIVATWLFRLDQHGVAVVGHVQPGLPALGLPSVSIRDVPALLSTSGSMFLVIVAQSAATARSFAHRHEESLQENRDLLGLGVANLLAGLSGTFVVNGSPTKTAVVEAAGGRTQVAQLVTALLVLAVLLVATGPIERLPVAALAAIVFFIGAKLIDIRSLRQIYRFRKVTFAVAVGTALAVVFLGVERGIFLAIGLSVLDHLRREYHPKDLVLTLSGRHWKSVPADPGAETEPGLIVYRFSAPLFFANADYFELRLQRLVQGAPHPVRWLVLDMVSVSDVDYTAGLTVAAALGRLQQAGVAIVLSQADDVRAELDRFGIATLVGADHIYETVQAAIDSYREASPAGGDAVSKVATAPAVVSTENT